MGDGLPADFRHDERKYPLLEAQAVGIEPFSRARSGTELASAWCGSD
jgi:hypothetical protein